MKLGRVNGKVWAERKVPQLEGARLVIVQPIGSDGKDMGQALVAADPKNLAGSGDTIVFVTSTDAADAFDRDAPVNAAVVELVDSVS